MEEFINKLKEEISKEPVWAALKVMDIVDELAEEQKKSRTEDLATAIANGAYCRTCKHLPNEDCDCDIVFTGYEPKDEQHTERSDK